MLETPMHSLHINLGTFNNEFSSYSMTELIERICQWSVYYCYTQDSAVVYALE